MFKLANDILDVMESTWPIVAVTVMAIVSLRITYYVKTKKKFILYEEFAYQFVIEAPIKELVSTLPSL